MNSSAPPRSFRRLLRLIRKESSEILRDRRTIVTLVVMPLLLYPLLALAFQQFAQSHQVTEVTASYRFGFESAVDRDEILLQLATGLRALERQGQPGSMATGVPGEVPLFNDRVSEDLEADVLAGFVDIGFRVHRSSGSLVAERPVDWELLYREDSIFGREAAGFVERLCSASNVEVLRRRLSQAEQRNARIETRVLPLPLKDLSGSRGVSLGVLVPLILILMTITGAVYPAIDLTAGERERGTLEILVAAPIPRLALLFAKYVSVVLVAVLTALVNLSSMMITLWITGMVKKVFGPEGLRLLVIIEVFGLLLLFAAFFSAVLLVLTSFARSFKEAQAYLIPLMLVSLAPGLLSLYPELTLQGWLAITPLINIVLLARDLLEGQARVFPALLVIGSTSAYALGALSLAARLFGSEAVLYEEASGWGDLFRRRKESGT